MKTDTTTEELRQRIAVSPGEAAIMLGVDRSTVYKYVMPAVHTGKITSLKIGSARRILVASLLAWVDAEAKRQAA